FTQAGGQPASYVAYWNFDSWQSLGTGVNNYGFAIAVTSNGTLYAGGRFTEAGGQAGHRIASRALHTRSPLGKGLDAPAAALAVNDAQVYTGGQFATAGGQRASRIARWDGALWHPLDGGVNNDVSALAAIGNGVYAGGVFTQAAG